MIEGVAIVVVGGILLAACSKAVRWFRGPEMIPFEGTLWPHWAQDMKRDEGAVLVIKYERQDYVARGYEVVLRGRWPFRREVHADRKSEYALLMKPKRKPKRKQ
jgi:hypothetical protein